jgi:hypothetical protein
MLMTFAKTLGAVAIAAATLTVAAAPAMARPMDHRHERQVCKMERHHGKRVKVCHWAHR